MITAMGLRTMMLPHDPFVKTLARSLREKCRVPTGARLLVAVSGGADSVALLRGLAVLAAKRTWHLQLEVAHIQHHLRPDRQAEGDAKYVQRLAGKLELPFHRADLDPNTWRGNVESAARHARYQALQTLARDLRADGIVTAHHADDQLETILMRLLRGTSVRGLSAMAWRRRLPSPAGEAASPLWLYRPLLGMDRQDILTFLRTLRQRWREDATNDDATRWRARLRRDVLPVLREMKPDAAHRAAQLAGHCRQMNRVLETAIHQAAAHVRWIGDAAHLPRADARAMLPLVRGGVLRQCLMQLGLGADHLGAGQLRPILRAIADRQGGRRVFQLSQRYQVEVTRAGVVMSKGQAE